MNLLCASFSIFWLNEWVLTRWRCGGLPPWTRKRDRDPYHFLRGWPGAAWRYWNDPIIEGGWFIGRCAVHRLSAETHRRSSWAPSSHPISCRSPSRRGRTPHCPPSWAVSTFWAHELIPTLSFFLYFSKFSKLYASLYICPMYKLNILHLFQYHKHCKLGTNQTFWSCDSK